MNILTRITTGDKRSVKAKKNIIASTLLKGVDAFIYLALVPVTLGYLNAYEYGIWLTLSSILSWINSFDIGLGSGLRNKLGIAIATDDKEQGRSYVSTTFYMLIFITIIIFVVFASLINVIDWYALLNVSSNSVSNIKEIILVSFLFFCLNFILKFIGNVYQALQLPAINYLITFSAHLLSLIVIYVLTKTTQGSLFWVAIVYSAAPPLVYLLCYPVTFYKLYPYLAPSPKYFKKEYLKDLLSLSISFFVLQVMGIVLFSLSNLIISNMFGPDQVTPYNIAYRYFILVPSLFGLMVGPMWSAATDAYAKGDLKWIESSMYKVQKFLLLIAGILTLMVCFSKVAYHVWVGDEVSIPLTLSVLMAVYTMINLYSLSFSSFLFGMGVLRLQMINIVCVAILFYPVCYYFANKYGVNGIVIGMCLVNLSGAVLNRIQLNKILKGQAQGIWIK